MQGKPDNSKKARRQSPSSGNGQTQGRPPLPREVARSERVVTLVTEREKESLQKLAAAQSLSLSAVCHHLIAQGLQRREEKSLRRRGQGLRVREEEIDEQTP